MPAPSMLFTGDEVAMILAREALTRLGMEGGEMEVEMQTESNASDGVVSVRVTLHRKEPFSRD